jgi:hypothetical protein
MVKNSLVKLDITHDGKIIISVSSESCHMSYEQINLLIDDLENAQNDAIKLKDLTIRREKILEKYISPNKTKEDIPSNIRKILLEDQKF